ncbi:RluA family pseudouridine synthase [Fusibacter paucivorans]|uniref:Pseudouridine synthase n=1 Tax=Fusibacter paucivorans TaxID=76009 RepID=A0ABS5PQA3_9FIRM|nr:RluA family pseudouridine synthase [Fusibacter paucivorans]MBS7527350.1 RluA family pseudouridine synthase [Fusibacter paucivorans]
MFINEETLKLAYEIEAHEVGMTILDVMARKMNLSRKLIRRCKVHKQIALNGNKISVNAKVSRGDVLTIMLDHDENTFEPNPIVIEVLYEDADVMVVNKPPFLVVHPTRGHQDGTLANAISHLQYQRGQNFKIRFINRLDRDTSGVLLVGKNGYAHQIIAEQMQDDTVEKHYTAVVEGCVLPSEGTINAPIDRLEEGDVRRGVTESGFPSITHYKVLASNDKASLVDITLETGRTHQIRVHFQSIGHAIIGDTLYGSSSDFIDRQALHCREMCFRSPRKPEKTVVKAELPDDFKRLLKVLDLQDV